MKLYFIENHKNVIFRWMAVLIYLLEILPEPQNWPKILKYISIYIFLDFSISLLMKLSKTY